MFLGFKFLHLKITTLYIFPQEFKSGGAKGGFGVPESIKKTQPFTEKKFKRKPEADTFDPKSLDAGDFQTAVMRGNVDHVKQCLENGTEHLMF